jgi:hypothetical protein
VAVASLTGRQGMPTSDQPGRGAQRRPRRSPQVSVRTVRVPEEQIDLRRLARALLAVAELQPTQTDRPQAGQQPPDPSD